jgi:hypothetical protein
MRAVLLLPVFLCGCIPFWLVPPDDVDDCEEARAIEFESSNPLDGADEVWPWAGELSLSTSDVALVEWTLFAGDVDVASGTSEETWLHRLAVPELAPSTEHRLVADAAQFGICPSQDRITSTFTTGPWGLPLESDDVAVGVPYRVDLDTFEEPLGVGALVGLYIRYIPWLARLEEDGSLLFGFYEDGYDSAQDRCYPTVSSPNALDLAGSRLVAVWDEVVFPARVVESGVLVTDVAFDVIVAPDGSSLAGGNLSGHVDTRPMDIYGGGDGELGDLCALFEGQMGEGCTACEDGEPFCWDLASRSVWGKTSTYPASNPMGSDMVPWSCADVIAHHTATGECEPQLLHWRDGDGGFSGCPDWTE